ncbi:phage minor head protein [Synechococcus sp. PCC 6312]|uniref:phage head morphogenesis protein n=1 Tax=Synechococcus sp. (strain ATCC 27167 / PCC 6312) TaxID=195253 RepID=UPI00029ECC70|nr:phage minor head protein [Synechococcus sp. PCC 6312]AFY60347.1 phage head morphogenesis protein, SPP1 gp7 [Synechococcus sp. PCC 6312]
MPEVNYARLPFADAIEFFRGKVNADTDRWDDIWQEQHDTQFVVAGAKGAILQDFREAVEKAIAEGMSRADFLQQFDQIVATRGWDYKGGRDWRANLIYGTNLRTAYAAGRHQQQTEPSQLKRRPYWGWQHGDTRNPRPLHLALDGKVFRADDPFWQTMYPPADWGCQCQVVSLSERDLRRLGKDEPDIPPIVGGIMSAFDPKTGTMLAARVEAGAGWDYVPGQSNIQQRRQQVLKRLDPALQGQIMAEVQGPSNLSGTNQGQIRAGNTMAGRTPPPGIVRNSRFVSRHLPQGRDAQKLLQQGKAAHVFLDEATMSRVESDLLARGEFAGTVRGHDRYGLGYPEPIGYRIAPDGERQSLYYAELKVKDGEYHAVPRNKPAT